MLSVSREAVNTDIKVVGLTRLKIESESTAPEGDVLSTQLNGLINYFFLRDSHPIKECEIQHTSIPVGSTQWHIQKWSIAPCPLPPLILPFSIK